MNALIQILIEALGWEFPVPSKKESEKSQLMKAQRTIGLIIVIGVVLFVVVVGIVALLK